MLCDWEACSTFVGDIKKQEHTQSPTTNNNNNAHSSSPYLNPVSHLSHPPPNFPALRFFKRCVSFLSFLTFFFNLNFITKLFYSSFSSDWSDELVVFKAGTESANGGFGFWGPKLKPQFGAEKVHTANLCVLCLNEKQFCPINCLSFGVTLCRTVEDQFNVIQNLIALYCILVALKSISFK